MNGFVALAPEDWQPDPRRTSDAPERQIWIAPETWEALGRPASIEAMERAITERCTCMPACPVHGQSRRARRDVPTHTLDEVEERCRELFELKHRAAHAQAGETAVAFALTFQSTGIGTKVTIGCSACAETADISNYDSW